MRIFLAGATGAIGRRLVPLLLRAGHTVVGTTRSAAKAEELKAAGVTPAVVDVFDSGALERAVVAARPEIVIHQLTDLPRIFDAAELAAAYPRNARIRTEGTRNLVAAAQAATVRRFIVQSIAFGYAPGREPHAESDPLNLADGPRVFTVRGAADMEAQVLASGIEAIVLATASSTAPALGPSDRAASRRSTSMRPRMLRSSPSRAAGRASTTSPRTTAR